MNSFQQNVLKHKLGLLNLAAELGNVSRACKVMGFSRDTFYRYQSAMESGGVNALIDANRRKSNPKNRVEVATESEVAAFAGATGFGSGSRLNSLQSILSFVLYAVNTAQHFVRRF